MALGHSPMIRVVCEHQSTSLIQRERRSNFVWRETPIINPDLSYRLSLSLSLLLQLLLLQNGDMQSTRFFPLQLFCSLISCDSSLPFSMRGKGFVWEWTQRDPCWWDGSWQDRAGHYFSCPSLWDEGARTLPYCDATLHRVQLGHRAASLCAPDSCDSLPWLSSGWPSISRWRKIPIIGDSVYYF